MSKSALATMVLCSGCNGALVGNIVVLCVTFAIFFSTLRLGRSASATRSGAPSSSSTAGKNA